jgi:hypothetical protein
MLVCSMKRGDELPGQTVAEADEPAFGLPTPGWPSDPDAMHFDHGSEFSAKPFESRDGVINSVAASIRRLLEPRAGGRESNRRRVPPAS